MSGLLIDIECGLDPRDYHLAIFYTAATNSIIVKREWFNQYIIYTKSMHGNNNNAVNDRQNGRVSISTAAFAAKYRSKRECFNFLAVDCNVYLPAYGKSISPNSKLKIFPCP